jgi:lipoate-protein ligase A
MKMGCLVRPFDVFDSMFSSTRDDARDRVCVWRSSAPQIVLGAGSRPEAELVMETVLKDKIPVLRRKGGGCAVVLDPGNLVVARTEFAPGIGRNQAHFRRLTKWLLSGLEFIGITGLRPVGISDLACGDRKVAGSSLYRARNTLLYSVCLLVNADLPLMDRYLKHPPREPSYRKGRSHLDFVCSLKPKEPMDDLAKRLLTALKQEDQQESLDSACGIEAKLSPFLL